VKIYAFEPSVTTSNILKKNIEMNRLDGRIFHIQNAVSDTIGMATFNECEDDAYSSLKDTKRKKVLSKIEVPVTTVDVFVNDRKIPAISLIKIDVEGMEHEVLHGAEKTLNLYSPDVFVEIYGGSSSNPDPELTVRYMLSLGYKAFVSDGKCFIPFEVHSDERFNYYFTKG
jgi:FkbM family methyltransferase